MLLYQLRFQAAEIVEQLPEGARRLRRIIEGDRRSSDTAIEQVQKAATELERAANAAAPAPASGSAPRVQVEEPPVRVSQYLVWGSLSLVAGAMQVVMILFLSFFLLASGDLYRRKLVKIVGPSLEKKKITLQILRDIDHQIERFLVVQLFTSTLVGVATWLALRWIGFEQAAVWGLLAGVFNSIPYFGPVLVTGAIGVVAFLQFGEIRPILLAAGVGVRDHHPRGHAAHAVAHQPRGADERRGRLRRPAVLGMGVGRVGHSARGADADGHQGGLRPRRGLQPMGELLGD